MIHFRKILQLTFLVAIVGVMMMGCSTAKRCFKLYPPVVTTDTITMETVEYRDTIVEVILPGDTIYEELTVVIPCPDPDDSVVLDPGPVLLSDTVTADGSHSTASAWLEGRTLKVELIEHEQTLQIKLDSVIAIKDHYMELYTVEVHKQPPKNKKRVPWYYRASLPVAIILFILLLFCLRYRR